MAKHKNKNGKMRILTVYLPIRTIDSIDALVDLGFFSSRSEAIRNFTNEGLENHKDTLDSICNFITTIDNYKQLYNMLVHYRKFVESKSYRKKLTINSTEIVEEVDEIHKDNEGKIHKTHLTESVRKDLTLPDKTKTDLNALIDENKDILNEQYNLNKRRSVVESEYIEQ